MPVYEYRCDGCEKESEVLQRWDDPPPVCEEDRCPSKGRPKRKLVSVTTFDLRGGGWAKDGYGG